MSRLCTICARGGSQGLLNKNLRRLQGKPLIAHSLLQAKKTGLFEKLAVSSDSDQILEVSKEYGADYLIKRPLELASDTAPKIPAIQHCAKEAERLAQKSFEVIVDLDATSPLRTESDIVGVVRLLEEKKVSNVITGMASRRSPYFNLVETDENGFVRLSKKLEGPVVRRQDAPKCFDMNASIYAWYRSALFAGSALFKHDTMIYVMPEERSWDIDSEFDFGIVEHLSLGRELS